MPDSNEVSTNTADDQLIGTDPITYNAAIHASILRSMGRVNSNSLPADSPNPNKSS